MSVMTTPSGVNSGKTRRSSQTLSLNEVRLCDGVVKKKVLGMGHSVFRDKDVGLCVRCISDKYK